MTTDRVLALDECISRLRNGDTLDSCLKDIRPELAQELRPYLSVALELQKLAGEPVPASPGLEAGRARMLQRAAQLNEERVARSRWGLGGLLSQWPGSIRRNVAMVAIALSLFVVVLGGGTIASANSLPGDLLYSFKLAAEEVHLLLTPDPQVRVALRQQFAELRRQEVSAVTAAQRVAEMTFQGRVESIGEDVWVIWGVPVVVNEDTELAGEFGIGTLASVRVQTQLDGTILALEVVAEAEGAYPTATPSPTAAATTTPSPLPPTPMPTYTVEPPAVLVPSPTTTRTATPSPSATPTSTASATSIPPTSTPARLVRVKFSGMIEGIEEAFWRIGGRIVWVDAGTRVDETNATAQNGVDVDVVAIQRADGSLLAEEIVTQPVPGPKLVEFQGLIESFGPEEWTVGGEKLKISGDTLIEGTPIQGLLARVRALRYHDGKLKAQSIVVVPPDQVVQFEGSIEAMDGSQWIVQGTVVRLDSATRVEGEAAVGVHVEVEGVLLPDDSVLARTIVVTAD